MSFYTSLSGLQSAQTEMSTISHNLANVATNAPRTSSEGSCSHRAASSVNTAAATPQGSHERRSPGAARSGTRSEGGVTRG